VISRRTRTLAREGALTVGAGLGLVCLLLAVVAPLFGVRLLVFESGSMAPTVETGGLAVTRTVAADELAVGDIVSVTPQPGQRVTHRIAGIERAGDSTLLTLQGDANQTPDPERYPVTEADRVLVHVNHLGFVVDALASPYAVFLAGAFVAGVLLLAFRRRDPAPAARGRHRAPVAAAVAVAVALVGAASLVPSRVSPTAASFTDTAVAPSGSLGTTTVPPSASFSCGGLGVLSVAFNWTAVAGATSYTLHYGSGGSQTITGITGTSRTITSAISGGTAWVVAHRSFGSTTWSSVASNTRTYTVAVVSLCS
jgi:signal peptidase I